MLLTPNADLPKRCIIQVWTAIKVHYRPNPGLYPVLLLEKIRGTKEDILTIVLEARLILVHSPLLCAD
jgi:hypothetical protein